MGTLNNTAEAIMKEKTDMLLSHNIKKRSNNI